MRNQSSVETREAGFSLIELLIAMTITLVVLAVATTLIAQSLNMRTRSNENTDALADAERALNIMSREIAQSGFNMMPGDNGIVAEDCVIDGNGNSTIRVRANLNRYSLCECAGCPCASPQARDSIGVSDEDEGEDVKYFVYPNQTTTLLARYDRFALDQNGVTGVSTVLANRLDRLRIHYFTQKVTYTSTLNDQRNCDISNPSAAELPSPVGAKYVVIAVCVRQGETGAPGSPGYQPAHNLLLTSDVALRNANLSNY